MSSQGRNEQTDGRREGRGRGRGKMILRKQIKQRFLTSEEQSEQLLPGIPDEITLEHICTKLPWRAFHILSSVSRFWQQVIQRREVYDARVRSGSTETLVVFSHEDSAGKQANALYSMRENCCYQLPPIPFLESGISWTCGCISLDGKIYVIGGADKPDSECGTAEVYVLDVAGQRQWKQCTSMLEPRQRFGCGIIDGKIYVFGGMSLMKPVCGSEVYDPKVNAWLPINPMDTWRYDLDVLTLGEDFFVFDGMMFGPEFFERADDDDFDVDEHLFGGSFWDAYNPATNEWREVAPVNNDRLRGTKFTIKGKFHSMTKFGIHLYDFDKNLWTDLVSFPRLPDFDGAIGMDITLAVNDELVSVVNWHCNQMRDEGSCILQSVGFGGENREVLWQKVNCSLTVQSHFLFPIQL